MAHISGGAAAIGIGFGAGGDGNIFGTLHGADANAFATKDQEGWKELFPRPFATGVLAGTVC